MTNDTAIWTLTLDSLPADKTEVEVITPGGDQRDLYFESGLWWLPDHSMYCYFTPTHWRTR